VTHLAVYLENGQRVYFNAETLQQQICNPPKTALLAFFELCKIDDFAKTLLYAEVPSFYVWQANKTFARRKRGLDVVGWPGVKKGSALGRIYTVHPNNVECFYLRLLLHHVKGPTSFAYLRTVNAVEHPTFQAACMALGLLEDDNQWYHTSNEAILLCTPSKLRDLFVTILVFCCPSDPVSLWNKYKVSLSEDFIFAIQNHCPDHSPEFSAVFNQSLLVIEDGIQTLGGRPLKEYGLPEPKKPHQHPVNRDFHR